MNEFKGIVIKAESKTGTSSKTGEQWVAYTYVIQEVKDEYQQTGVFEVFGYKLPELKEGYDVNVKYNLKATEYNDKYFNKLQVWAIDVFSKGENAPISKNPATDDTDLPF